MELEVVLSEGAAVVGAEEAVAVNKVEVLEAVEVAEVVKMVFGEEMVAMRAGGGRGAYTVEGRHTYLPDSSL